MSDIGDHVDEGFEELDEFGDHSFKKDITIEPDEREHSHHGHHGHHGESSKS